MRNVINHGPAGSRREPSQGLSRHAKVHPQSSSASADNVPDPTPATAGVTKPFLGSMKFENLSVARKLWLTVTVILLAMTATAVVSQRIAARTMRDAMKEIQEHGGRTTQAVKWKGMTDTNTQRVIANASSSESNVAQAFAGPLKEGIAAIGILQKQIAESATLPEEKLALSTVADRRVVVLDLLKAIDAAKKTGAPQAVVEIVNGQLLPAVSAYMASLDAFIQVQQELSNRAESEARASSDRAAFWGGATIACVFGLSMLAVALLARSISRPLGDAVHAAQRIASGDLTAHLVTSRTDEIGRLMSSMNQMSDRLRALVGNVRSGVESVSTASQQIATGNQDPESVTSPR